MPAYPDDIPALKEQICDVGRRIWQRGFCAGNEGNHSVRIADDRILCTPTQVSKGFITPDMVATVDFDGRKIDGHPDYGRTSEVLMHLAIYRARPDVTAIVHSHPPHVTAFAVAGVPLPEAIHPEAEIFLGRVPMARYATASTPDLPASCVEVIGPESCAVMLASHGVTTFSAKGLIDAFYKLEVLESYATTLLNAAKLGRITTLTQDQFVALLEVKRDYFKVPDARLDEARRGVIGPHNAAFFEALGVNRSG